LSPDKGFYLIVFPLVGQGQYELKGHGTRRKGIAALRDALQQLELRPY
jgi:hypothetical protein